MTRNANTDFKALRQAYIFTEKGLLGFKNKKGDIVLPAEYDRIEPCTEFIYCHTRDRSIFIQKNGTIIEKEDSNGENRDLRFYKNGHVGLLKKNGSELLPAKYDEIIDWGMDGRFDVIYARKGKEYHYYNHSLKEILTGSSPVIGDRYPLCPYSFGEDQNRKVLLCVEPTTAKAGNSVCFAYGQYVRLSRIPYRRIRSIFQNCTVFPVSKAALDLFYDKNTYIYSARTCSSKATEPICDCIKKLHSLDCYNSSWNYLVKITANRNTAFNSDDLLQTLTFYEDLEDCISCHIAIGYDDTLDDGEIRMLQIHFFWDDGGAFLDDVLTQKLLPGSSQKAIQAEYEKRNRKERKKFVEKAYWYLSYNKNRSIEELDDILRYLDSISCDPTGIIGSMQSRMLHLDTEHGCEFEVRMLQWAIEKGAHVNKVGSEGTLLDRMLCEKTYFEEQNTACCGLAAVTTMITMLERAGCMTVGMKRKTIEKESHVLPISVWLNKYLNS